MLPHSSIRTDPITLPCSLARSGNNACMYLCMYTNIIWLCMIKARIRWCSSRLENILTLGKLLRLWFCFLHHSILFFISQTSYRRTYKIISSYELARPIMGTIFLVYIYIYIYDSRLNRPESVSLASLARQLGMCSFQHKWARERQLYLFVLLHHVIMKWNSVV